MFEKEAENYADKNETRGGGSSFGDETNYHDLRQAFKDGAEFGYIKAKEELKKAGEIIQLFLDANNELDMINAQRRAEDFIKEI